MLTAFSLALLLTASPTEPGHADHAPSPTITCASDSGLAVIPARLDLGDVAAGSTITAAGWLINTSNQSITIDRADPGCGCTTVAFEPVSLAPGQAHAFSFEVKTPTAPEKTKRIPIRFTPTWGDPVTMSTTLRTSADGAASTSTAPAPVTLTPTLADLGEVPVGSAVDASVWIINAGSETVRIGGISTGCGCTTVVGFAPTALGPGQAQRVRLRVAPTQAAPSKQIPIRARLNDGDQLETVLQARITSGPERVIASD